jgi:hypothetical protein
MVPIGRPDIQKLYGVAMRERAVAVFFSLMAYTREAQGWADQVGMALFRFDHAGEAEPVNRYAAAMFDRAQQQEPRPAEPLPTAAPPPPRWSFPIGCTDQTAYERLRPPRSGLRQVDQLVWIRQSWLPFASLRYDYSYVAPSGRRYEEHFAHTRVAIELRSRRAIGIPAATGNMVPVPPEQVTIQPRWTSAELADEVRDLWIHSIELVQPAAIRRTWDRLSEYGVPSGAKNLRVTDEGTLLLPFFAALIRGAAGNRIAVAEGVTGQVHSVLSLAFTQDAPYLLDSLYSGRQVAWGRFLS